MERDRSRFWSMLFAVLFLPAALVAWVLSLASERASRCVTYGEQCTGGLPAWLFDVGVGLGAVACVIALAAPTLRVRQVAVAVQVQLEFVALVVILSHA
ncbi:hypothetical protein ABZ845_23735 [Streptomyces sp. NPDC047022]|uniref:hypothetical protein n=1 Tax=Streptomyces sp. NPDC047022 TaxID=3155737 RepID=UPI0033EAD86B